jgi:hypothetical protein
LILTTFVAWTYIEGIEIKKLVLSATTWGTGIIPKDITDISNEPSKEEIILQVKASTRLEALEIPEYSPIKGWAESKLAGSSVKWIDIKIDDKYYRVKIQYLNNYYTYPKYITQITLIVTMSVWIVFAIFSVVEISVKPKKDNN